MKKNIGFLFFFILTVSTIVAQDAQKILDKLAAHSKSCETMQGNFEYTLENKAANVYENSNGSFLIKGDKYFVNVLGVETYYDGKSLYSFIKDVNEVSIQEPEQNDEDFLKPSNLFTIYQKGYSYKYVGKIIEDGKNMHVIDLLPKNDSQNYKKLIVKIDTKTNNLISMKSIGKSGDDVEVRITKMKKNITVPDSKFTFNKALHTDVEVIDMR